MRRAAAVMLAVSALSAPPAAQERVPASPPARPAGSAPDYARVFGLDRVHDMRIEVAGETFRAMQEDLRSVMPGFGFFAARGAGGARGGGAVPDFGVVPDVVGRMTAACSEKAADAACSIEGIDGKCTAFGQGPPMCLPAAPPGGGVAAGRGFGGGAPLALTTRDPAYVPVTVHYEGRTWSHVGMRYKGNSSLMMANVGRGGKLPFRLDFDQYENEFPATRNQRFFGFKKLTFSSNMGDDSQLREAFATEVFRDRGVPAARAAFYRVFVDTGAGPEYWGLFTMIEDPADGAMLDAQFGGRGGNLYKPDGRGADWTVFARDGFAKKTNKKPADFSDVESAIAALHAPQTDARAWRAGLEARFDVDLFLCWLAVNTAMQNWDVYGTFAHNYYVYGDPGQNGRLRWIPWDHNFSLGGFFGLPPGMAAGPPGGLFPGGGGPRGAGGAAPPVPFGLPGPGGPPNFGPAMLPMMFGGNDVLHRQAGPQWPLIGRLLADEVYAARYRQFLQQALRGLFAPDAAARRLRELHALIAPAIVGERGERPTHTTISSRAAFERSIDGPDGLVSFVRARHEAVRTALGAAAAR